MNRGERTNLLNIQIQKSKEVNLEHDLEQIERKTSEEELIFDQNFQLEILQGTTSVQIKGK